MFKQYLAAGILGLSLSSGIQAEEISGINPVLSDRFNFKLGALNNNVSGTVKATKPPFPEVDVDLEDDLGVKGNDLDVWIGFRWRFSERWALNASFNRFDSSGDNVVTDSFNWEGVEYPVGALVTSNLQADAYIVDVSYAFIKQDNKEFGGGIGLHAFDLSASVDGAIQIGDLIEPFASDSQELLAPVPNLRLYYLHAFNPKVSAHIRGGWLSASYEDYDGAFTYAAASVEYRFNPRFGAGIGYQYTKVDVEHDKGDGEVTEFDVEFDGFQAYLTYSF